MPENCLEGCEEVAPVDRIDSVAAKITPENIRAFYKRLIEKRPKAFYKADDFTIDRDYNEITDNLNLPECVNLPEYVGYSEIEFGAMLQVFGATQFINDGGRGNKGRKSVNGQEPNSGVPTFDYYVSAPHEKFGYISAIAGMRLETPDPAMERLHVIAGERQKAVDDRNKAKGSEEKGSFARMKGVNNYFVEGHELIWNQFYQLQEGPLNAVAVGSFNDEVAKQRLYISYKKFLAESIANAKRDGKKAHIRITGCGDGEWAGSDSWKPLVKSAIGKAVRRAFDDLNSELRSQISAIEFCEFGGENYCREFRDGNEAEAINGVKIIKSHAKFSHELEKNEKRSGDQDTVLCVNFAWDGGSYVGNEYWADQLSLSGDPAAACCSSIAISMNPEINQKFLDKLFVVSKTGEVSEVGRESSARTSAPELAKQETKTNELEEPKQLEAEWTKKYGYIDRREEGLTNDLAKSLTKNITTKEQANSVLRDVQASITRLEDGRSDDAAFFLRNDFLRNGVSEAVRGIFFEENEGKVSFKKTSFKNETPNADALTNVSHLVARHAELIDPNKNLAKKLIKYQLQEIQKIKEGSPEEKIKNSEQKAHKIKTLRNLAVYLGASNNTEGLAIGDNHEDASEFVNLLCDALYESPPFRLEKTSIAVDHKEYSSVRNDPAYTLQTELPEAKIIDGKRVFDATSFKQTIDAYQKTETLGTELNEERYRAEVLSEFNRTPNTTLDFNDFYQFKVDTGGLQEYLESADVLFDTKEGKKKFKTQSQLKAFVSGDVSEIVVSTKRFAVTEAGEGYKLENEVTLDPITFLVDGGSEGETKTFEPTAVILHNGNLNGGHYISYVKENDNDWYCYNDKERSGPIKRSDVIKAQKDSYIVKYSAVETLLPEAQAGAENLTRNMCWANATAALMASCSSLLSEEIVLTQEEKSILDSDLAREKSQLKQVSRDLSELSEDINRVINQKISSQFNSSSENPEGSYLDDKASKEIEVEIHRTQQEYFLQNIRNSDSYYDFQTLNFFINIAPVGDVKLVEYDAQPTHEINLNKGIENLFDEPSCLRGLVIPMRPDFDFEGIPKSRGHFTGLYVTREEGNSFKAVYIDPTGKGKNTDIPQYVMEKLGAFGITRDNIELTTNKIQHCTESRVDEVVMDDGTSVVLPTDASPSNDHCGAFIADILSGLISGEKSIHNCRIQSKSKEGNWQDLPDLDKEESDAKGKEIRKYHSTLLEKDNISETISKKGYSSKKRVSFEDDQIKKERDSFSLETKRQIEEKILVNPDEKSENLSAIEVAIKKSTASIGEEKAAKNNLENLGFLEYAAKSVLSKAIKAKNKLDNDPRDTVEAKNWGQKDPEQWKKESQKVWNSRCVRTDFKGVDLSGTFRTVFVNCTFDENCVLPTDKSSIDQKYFSKCKFSKELMDKEENKELKAALEKNGMELAANGNFYEVGEMKREKYGAKDREGKPNPSFKPIESFQFIKDFKPVERGGH